MKLILMALLASTLLACSQDYTFNNFAGVPGVTGGADGNGTGARFNFLTDVATDSAGNVYVADYGSSTIRRITPAGEVRWRAQPLCGGLSKLEGVTKGTPPPVFEITSITFVSGNVQIDFISAPSDSPDLFTLQSSGAVSGTYGDVTPPATITQLGTGSFRAVVAPSGGTQFYRLKK